MLTTVGSIAQYANVTHGWDLDSDNIAHLTYYFGSVTGKVAAATVQSEIERALNAWSAHLNVTFTQSTISSVTRSIYIEFASGSHGDAYPFDGPGGVLAHTFYPVPINAETIAGDMHFDADEAWKVGADTDIYTVALHEIGHALGLSHSDNPGDVMYPYYHRGLPLSANDIGAAKQLYAPATPEAARARYSVRARHHHFSAHCRADSDRRPVARIHLGNRHQRDRHCHRRHSTLHRALADKLWPFRKRRHQHRFQYVDRSQHPARPRRERHHHHRRRRSRSCLHAECDNRHAAAFGNGQHTDQGDYLLAGIPRHHRQRAADIHQRKCHRRRGNHTGDLEDLKRRHGRRYRCESLGRQRDSAAGRNHHHHGERLRCKRRDSLGNNGSRPPLISHEAKLRPQPAPEDSPPQPYIAHH